MPTITYIREWCKSCNEFTLHDEKSCRDCKTEFTEFYLSEVPREKIIAQRQRYNEYKRKGFGGLLIRGITEKFSSNPFAEGWPKPEIIESDAGQREIDENRYKLQEEERKQRILLREEAEKTYSKLGRNDICPTCLKEGLTIKFKKCKHFEKYKSFI